MTIHPSSNSGLACEDVDIVKTDETSGVVSRHFHPQIVEPVDIEKIQAPVITYDADLTEARYQTMCDLFGDILPVVRVGIKGSWFAPWDELIRWWGVEAAMKDLVDRPEMVDAAMTRLVDGYIAMLDQWEALNLLTRNDDNTRIGSGGYGYTGALPGEPYDPQRPRPHNLWGCATAQIFGSVSPKMHWEFALKHEMRWLERWGLTYYGCCRWMLMGIRAVNLRKLNGPWINTENGAQRRYRLCHVRKPNPAVLAGDLGEQADS